VIWAVALQQGRARTECAGRVGEELVLAAAPSSAFAGAGVFSPNGRLRGAVVNCGDRLAVMSRAVLDNWITGLAAAGSDSALTGAASSTAERVSRRVKR
jgi:hypothetical protein